jgi:hypothetical protein
MEKSISPALKVLIAGSSGGGAAGFTSQFLTELWSFVIEGKPVTVEAIKGSGARSKSHVATQMKPLGRDDVNPEKFLRFIGDETKF